MTARVDVREIGRPRIAVALVMAAIGVVATSSASAQTIRPFVSEHKEQARGRVELGNSGDQPLDVLLHTRGFTVSPAGQMVDDAAPADVHVKLSAMSLRIPAGQSRFVFYEANAARLPAWFVLYAIFSGPPVQEMKGINVEIELPHVVYILPKTTLEHADLRTRVVEYRPGDGRVVLDIENVGSNFGRILSTEVRSQKAKVDAVGFPLLPGGRRRLEVAWKATDDPEKVVLKGRGFVFEQKLSIQDP